MKLTIGGFFSMMKAIYWPDVDEKDDKEKEKRQEALENRLLQMAASLGLFAGDNFTRDLLWRRFQ